MSRRLIGTLIAAALLALGATACGDDSGDSGSSSAPETISVPAGDSQTVPGTTTPGGTTTGGSGGTSTGSYDPNLPDSQNNDKPPPAGSPAERFERACKQNPATCG
ncbi:MAG: hypothetical protein EXQ70_00420 [Solirubrobacterales bacterium]|nr:hypothetical protein [Solirubrobacterales bacterium]